MKAIDGGITMAMEDAAASSVVAKFGLKPSLSTIAGTKMEPSAATVAGPEPDSAPKKHATMTDTMAIPPFLCPTQASANSISLSEIPAFAMILPARTKNGIASSRNFACPE